MEGAPSHLAYNKSLSFTQHTHHGVPLIIVHCAGRFPRHRHRSPPTPVPRDALLLPRCFWSPSAAQYMANQRGGAVCRGCARSSPTHQKVGTNGCSSRVVSKPSLVTTSLHPFPRPNVLH